MALSQEKKDKICLSAGKGAFLKMILQCGSIQNLKRNIGNAVRGLKKVGIIATRDELLEIMSEQLHAHADKRKSNDNQNQRQGEANTLPKGVLRLLCNSEASQRTRT